MLALHRRRECPLTCNPWPVDIEEKEQLPARRLKSFGHTLSIGIRNNLVAYQRFIRILPQLTRQTTIEWAGVNVGAMMFVGLTNVIA
jgi:hypothetical protein